MFDMLGIETLRDIEGKAIGVVTIAGEIVDGRGGPGSAAAETIARAICVTTGSLKGLFFSSAG